jgi:hypothetical protein
MLLVLCFGWRWKWWWKKATGFLVAKVKVARSRVANLPVKLFRLSTSLTFSRPHSYSQINSLFDEARHRVGHDFDVSGFHEGWKCGIYGLTCEGHDLSTLDSSYREDM